MRFRLLSLLLIAGPAQDSAQTSAQALAHGCDIFAASPWIARWFGAWELTAREILRLPDVPAPNIVFYDSVCVYTTSNVTAGLSPSGATPAGAGPMLCGQQLPWRTTAHGDTLTLPDGSRVPVQLMSYAGVDKQTGPFFVMAAQSYWERVGRGPQKDAGLAVFLHEFAHTRQVRGMRDAIGPIDSTWSYPEELTDDAVQTHFGADSLYVEAYVAERDLLYRAAAAASREDVLTLATEALAMMKRRHARWFIGEKAEFAILDDTFLSLEGAAQWAAAAWLAHPEGGGLTREEAVAKMLGKRRWWAQDEGLALFLVVDRLLPGWPRLVFHDPSIGGLALLERAVGSSAERSDD